MENQGMPVFGFTGVGTPKTKTKGGRRLENTPKIFPGILRKEWEDFGRKVSW